MRAARKFINIVRYYMLASIVLYGWLVWRLPSTSTPNASLFRVITILALSMAIIVFAVWRIRVLPAGRTLTSRPNDAGALFRWRQGYLITYVFSQAIALYGVVLHFMGNPLLRVLPFFIAAFVLMLVLRPQPPAPEFPPDAKG